MDHASCSRSRSPAASEGTSATSSTSRDAGSTPESLPSDRRSPETGAARPSPRRTTLTRSMPRGAAPSSANSVQSSLPVRGSDQTVTEGLSSPAPVKRNPSRAAVSASPRTCATARTLREVLGSRTGSEAMTARSPPKSSARIPFRPLRRAEREGSQKAAWLSSTAQPSVFSKEYPVGIRLPGTAATASDASAVPPPRRTSVPSTTRPPAPAAARTTTSTGPSLELFRDRARSSAVITSEPSSSSPSSKSIGAGAGAEDGAGAEVGACDMPGAWAWAGSGAWAWAWAWAGRRVGIGAAAGSSRTSSSGSSSISSSPPKPPGAGASWRRSSSVNSTAPRAN